MPRKAQSPSLADEQAAAGGVAAVDRALSLLTVFDPGDQALNLTELAKRTRMYKSTTLRLLASLEHAGFVQRQPNGRYSLGVTIARLHGIYSASFSLEGVVLPALYELVGQTGESAAYHVRQGAEEQAVRLCLYRVDSPNPVRDSTKIGDLLPIDRGAGARVLQAFAADALPAASEDERELYNRIKRQGYCALVGDRVPQIAGISAPVFAQDKTLMGALTLSMPSSRYDERHVQAVVQAAQKISHKM